MTINMSSDFCRDVVDHLSNSQIISAESVSPTVGAVTCRSSSAAVELGRRLLAAARSGDTETVLELMARGAPFSSDWLGTSPLHLAAKHAHADTCAVLLRAGVSRDVRTKVDRTPLHLAAYGGHARVVTLLLEQGAHVDPRDMLRMTPLHWAAERGHTAAVAALLRHGADPSAASKFRKTPLALAAAADHHHIVRLIEDAIREREAAQSVDALLTEHMAETPTPDPNIQQFESIVQKIKDTKPATKCKAEEVEPDVKITQESGGGGGGVGEGAGAQLLRRHGITLLPHDPSSTVLNAIHSGRTVVLSDAGKLMLKESEGPSPAKRMAPSGAKGVVLTATPVKTAPKPGVKIFTLNNKLIALPKQNKMPIKQIINPHLKQVKIVKVKSEAKAMAPAKASPAAVKIFMNKTNFNKLMANTDNIQTGIHENAGSAASESRTLEEDVEEILRVPEDFLQRCSTKYLRAHALAARRALAALKAHFDDCTAVLPTYQNSGG